MNCSKISDIVYEYSGNEPDGENAMPFLNQLQVWFHTLICPDCAREIEKLELSRRVMREDFLPSSAVLPDGRSWQSIEDSIMARINAQEETDAQTYAVPGGLSTRGWVIAGVIIMVSLVTAFFGLDFKNIAAETGTSFLLPVGIVIGTVLTTYGALFIGSHLKELTERFDL
ncbi:MAG: peptidoglycan-binding protein [Treponema sp.]|jgi:hypothetical protein|nr:peptidoglycan-binding protein [Treponema sp.]